MGKGALTDEHGESYLGENSGRGRTRGGRINVEIS